MSSSRPNFKALAMEPVAFALASKVQASALRTALTVFGITMKLKINNSYNNKLIIIYT